MLKKRIQSKHQRLILQCYPPGKNVDKKPNASELSYLLYYVSARRAKLAKVGVYLEKLTRSDVSHGRSGNVAVTLSIVNTLITKCHEDLNLFASNVVVMLITVLNSGDLALCQHASQVFSTLCSRHDNALIAGDPDYVRAFNDLVRRLSAILSQASGPNAAQWQLVAIEAYKGLASSSVMSTAVGPQLIALIVPLMLSTLNSFDSDTTDQQQLAGLKRSFDRFAEAKAASSASAPPVSTKRASMDIQDSNGRRSSVVPASAPVAVASPTSTRALLSPAVVSATSSADSYFESPLGSGTGTPMTGSTSVHGANGSISAPPTANGHATANGLTGPTDYSVKTQVTALDGIQSLFDSTNGPQIRYATRSTIDYFKTQRLSAAWAALFFEMAARWAPVQLRFVILSSLVDCLVGARMPLQGPDELQFQLRLTKVINSLLSSSVNMVGLSVIDLLRALLSYQHQVINDLPNPTRLAESLHQAIASISCHIYYADQVPDMVAEILSRSYQGTLGTLGNGGVDGDLDTGSRSRTNTVAHNPSTIISDLRNVEAILKLAYNKSHTSLEWKRVPLLSWEGAQSLISHSSWEVRNQYTRTFLTYLQLAVLDSDCTVKWRANFSITRSTLGRIALHLYLTAIDPLRRPGDYVLLNQLFYGIISHLGTNGIVRLVPFAFMMNDAALKGGSEPDAVNLSPGQVVALSSLSLSILFFVASKLKLDVVKTTLAQSCQARKQAGTWFEALELTMISVDLPAHADVDSVLPSLTELSESQRQSLVLDRLYFEQHLVVPDLAPEIHEAMFKDVPIFANDSDHTESATIDQSRSEINVHRARSLRYPQYSQHFGINTSPQSRAVSAAATGDDISVSIVGLSISTAEPREGSVATNPRSRIFELKQMAQGTLAPPKVASTNSSPDLPAYVEKLDIDSYLSSLSEPAKERGRLF